MKVLQLFLLHQIILIPIIMCIVRYADIKQLYIPLFLYLLVKEATEIISILLIRVYDLGNEEPYNIMYLLEALLINWQFYKLGAYGKYKNVYTALQILWLAVWVIDIWLLGSIHKWNIVFRIIYCSILIFIAVSLISKLTISSRMNVYHNTGFLLCLIFACWFAYNIVYEFAERIADAAPKLEALSKRVTNYIGFAEAFLYLGCAWAIHCVSPNKRIHPFKPLFSDNT